MRLNRAYTVGRAVGEKVAGGGGGGGGVDRLDQRAGGRRVARGRKVFLPLTLQGGGQKNFLLWSSPQRVVFL